MSGGWKKIFDLILDRALGPLLTVVLSTALIVGLREKLLLSVPLWTAIAASTIAGVLGYGFSQWRNRRRPTHPTDTLRIFLRQASWSLGYKDQRAFRDGKPTSAALHVKCEATNISESPVRLVAAHLSRWHVLDVSGWAATCETDGQAFSSKHYIPPAHTAEVLADFQLVPPPLATRRGRSIVAKVRFVDHWGNVTKAKRIAFEPPPPRPAPEGQRPAEKLHAIRDPIEKDVAAVLKAEIDRYRAAGRRTAGLLGSVTSKQPGSARVAGIGSDWRLVDSPDQQALVHGIELPAIGSDNADALVALHSRLTTEAERRRFMDALLRRLDRTTEYAEVAYLTALASFRIGELSKVLTVAKERLLGDDGFGFGEVVRIVDALLRLEHPAFSVEHLDDIERFADGLPDNDVVRLRERLFAIRAHRVRTGAP